MGRAEIKSPKLGGASRRLPLQKRAWARSRRDRANLTVPPIRSRGMIRLGEAAPALQVLRARMRASEIHTEDLPAANVRLPDGLPEQALVVSRVDLVAEHNHIETRPL